LRSLEFGSLAAPRQVFTDTMPVLQARFARDYLKPESKAGPVIEQQSRHDLLR
jgi:hypothetical protein